MSPPINRITLAARSLLAGVMATKHLPNDTHSALGLISAGVSFALACGVSSSDLTKFFAEMLAGAEKVHRLLKAQQSGMVSLDEALRDARANVGRN